MGNNEDYKDRDDSEHRDEEETSLIPQGQPGRFRMESRGYARHTHKEHPKQAKCKSQEEAYPVKTMGLFSRTKPGASHTRNDVTRNCEGSLEAHKKNSNTQQVHL